MIVRVPYDGGVIDVHVEGAWHAQSFLDAERVEDWAMHARARWWPTPTLPEAVAIQAAVRDHWDDIARRIARHTGIADAEPTQPLRRLYRPPATYKPRIKRRPRP